MIILRPTLFILRNISTKRGSVVRLLISRLLCITMSRLSQMTNLTLYRLLKGPSNFLTNQINRSCIRPRQNGRYVDRKRRLISRRRGKRTRHLFTEITFPHMTFRGRIINLPMGVGISLNLNTTTILYNLYQTIGPSRLAKHVTRHFLHRRNHTMYTTSKRRQTSPSPTTVNHLGDHRSTKVMVRATLRCSILSSQFKTSRFIRMILRSNITRSNHGVYL